MEKITLLIILSLATVTPWGSYAAGWGTAAEALGYAVQIASGVTAFWLVFSKGGGN